MDDAGLAQVRPQRARAGGGGRHREQALGHGASSPVLVRNLGGQALGGVGRNRRQQDAVVVLARAGEAPEQLSDVGLAAAELARDQRQQRDPDHAAILWLTEP